MDKFATCPFGEDLLFVCFLTETWNRIGQLHKKIKDPTWYKSYLNHLMQVQADILLSTQAGLDLLQMH